ncbi:MAG: mammalian cell entry protein [Burkholderiales bacterium]|nr:mammalian cell entry protein [Burkholderiales bacterium]
MPHPEQSTPPVAHLELKATLLLILMGLLLAGTVLYVLYARGVFEPTQRLTLIAENSEGVVVGMDMTFAGFPIGRVRAIELGEAGNARILIDVPRKDARWLRESSVYTLVRGLLGNTNLRAYTGIPEDPPLKDGAEKPVLIGDAAAEIPRLTSAVSELLQRLGALTAPDSALGLTLANVRDVSEKLKGPGGALSVLMGNEADARKLILTIERGNALLARVDGAVARLDGMIGRTDRMIERADAQVLGDAGLMRDVRATVTELNATLAAARTLLAGVQEVVGEAKGAATNARVATADLGVLRADVEANLRKLQHLLDEISRRWPFARDTELKLP